ncbi:MAG TPA: PKD domain-containing protein, partial [Conexibacter sp.]|nr:PKD domain-containing protein [Conexibacter sp.]
MQRSRRLVLLIATVAAWAVCASSAHAVGWLPGPTFGEGESFAGTGGVATDGAGVSTVVWVTSDAGGPPTAYAQRVSADGGRGPRVALGPIASSADVAGTAAGSIVAWAQPTADDDLTDVTVAWIGADSSVTTRTVATATLRGTPVVAAEQDGDVFVAWPTVDDSDATVLNARRIAADGTLGPIADLGEVFAAGGGIDAADAAVSGDGLARIAWVGPVSADDESATVHVARFGATGALEAAGTIAGSRPSSLPLLAGGGGGAVVTWAESVGGGGTTARLRAALLPSSASLTGAPVTIAGSLQSFLAGQPAAVAVTPDGTATIAYSSVDVVQMTGSVVARRLSAGGALSPEMTLSTGSASGQINVLPFLAPGAGGSLVAVWVRASMLGGGGYVSRGIAADGTLAPQIAEIPLSLSQSDLGVGLQYTRLAGSESGNAILASFKFPTARDGPPGPPSSYVTALLDASAPVVSASIPATVQRGADATFSATATDASGIAGFAWQFGDGSGAGGATVTHAYGRAGSYPVTLTVTDRTGNETVVTGTITVTEPVVPAPPAPPAPPVQPGPGPVVRAPARLKLTSASRA